MLDLAELKRILHAAVVDQRDHRNLNTDVPFLRDVIPSTENLVIAFWHEIEPRVPAGELHRMRPSAACPVKCGLEILRRFAHTLPAIPHP